MSNPWQVDSIQDFSCLKCPECGYNTKQETFFQDHAVENHPLSFVLFGKMCNEEELVKNLTVEFKPVVTETYNDDSSPKH